MVLFIGVSVVLAVVLLLLVRPIVNVMSTPAEAVEGTVRYLTICFIGIPFITAYNVIASIFRGLGDSKSPMYFIAIACVANIALDYIFIGAFHMGPEGAALGTTLSQTISVVVSLWVILKKQTGISVKREDFRPDRVTMGQVLKIGIPIAAQDGFIQVAFIIITIIANRRGCDGNCGWFRTFRLTVDSGDRRNGGWSVYDRCGGHPAGSTVYPWIHLGLHFRRSTFQFQWIFLCVWKIRDLVYPQPDRDSLCSDSGRISDFKDLSGYSVSDGTGYGNRISAVGDHLYDRI